MANPVDDYIAALAPLRAERVAMVRRLAHAAFPDIAESIDWKMPVFRRGDRYVAVASQKQYLSVYLDCKPLAAQVIASDPKLKGGKSCVNIRDNVAMPEAVLAVAIAEALT
jgi:uncharacterized protein YdhG (YjbR/CyaY superfamily)